MITHLELILFICLGINGCLFLFLAHQIRHMIKLNLTLAWLCLNSIALRHCWRTQIYGLMAVVDKEKLLEK